MRKHRLAISVAGFVKRCKTPEISKLIESTRVEQMIPWHLKNEENRQKYRESQRKYSLSEKGKEACRRKSKIRHKREQDAWKKLTIEEMEEVYEFYHKIPLGYVIDHIIPLSKGGSFHVSNLQYLTPQANSLKASKISP